MNADARILLVDNGSLEPASTRQLRRLAEELEARVGAKVVPASIAHSAAIPAEQLDGQAAELFETALDRVLREGAIEVRVVPLFVGPSYAIVRHLPAVIAERQNRFPRVRIALADPLFVAGEPRLASILASHVREVLATPTLAPQARLMVRPDHQSGLDHKAVTTAGQPGRQQSMRVDGGRSPVMAAADQLARLPVRSDHQSGQTEDAREGCGMEAKVRVAVVDHGSPSRAVTNVRDAVAAQVRGLLGDEVAAVTACSMERRAGPEYAFNDPLLANLLREDGWRDGPVIVALLFIAPGKHAGDEGDVAQIMRRARPDGGAGVRFTPVMGMHPLLLDILADRAREARGVRVEPGAVSTM